MNVTYSLSAVSDDGIFLLIRADNIEGSEANVVEFDSTQGTQDLIGTDDDKATVVTMLYFPDDVDVLKHFLILSGNREKKFKDVNVEVLTN